VFPTGPSAGGSWEGGDAVELEKLGSHLEEVCGAVCGNSGARSLLVEKSKGRALLFISILSNFGSLVSMSVFPPQKHSFPKQLLSEDELKSFSDNKSLLFDQDFF